MAKRAQQTCRCSAYPFPHRWRGGKCQVSYPRPFPIAPDKEDEQDLEYYDSLERMIIRPSKEFEHDN